MSNWIVVSRCIRPFGSFSRTIHPVVLSRALRAGCAAAVFIMLAAPAGAQAVEGRPASGSEVRVPQTAEDHLELATLYRQAASEQRQRAEARRKSLVAEIARVAVGPNKTGIANPWVTKLKGEAQPEIFEAETAAAEAERLAEFHRMRAKELEGLEFATLKGSQGERR